MVAMVVDLSLVKALAVLADRILLVTTDLGMVVAAVAAQMMEQHQTMLVEMAQKVLSELRCTTKKLPHNSNSQE
jgi:branched-subunit amino acid ABC-type transport system permease component